MNPSFTPVITLQIEALAYDRSLKNRRPVFAMRQTVNAAGSSWKTERSWSAVGPEMIALERAQRHTSTLHISTELPSLQEYAAAEIADGTSSSHSEVITRLSSGRTGGQMREREFKLPHPLVTLTTLPLFIAENWNSLLRGEIIAASYLVLKVQRAATVDLQWVPNDPRGAHVAVTPRNWLLRAIFGSTRLYTQGKQAIFLWQEGLLDPRDLKHGGRWKEYLGVLEFQTPWDLTSLCKKDACNELA